MVWIWTTGRTRFTATATRCESYGPARATELSLETFTVRRIDEVTIIVTNLTTSMTWTTALPWATTVLRLELARKEAWRIVERAGRCV